MPPPDRLTPGQEARLVREWRQLRRGPSGRTLAYGVAAAFRRRWAVSKQQLRRLLRKYGAK